MSISEYAEIFPLFNICPLATSMSTEPKVDSITPFSDKPPLVTLMDNRPPVRRKLSAPPAKSLVVIWPLEVNDKLVKASISLVMFMLPFVLVRLAFPPTLIVFCSVVPETISFNNISPETVINDRLF